jgi:hypothetical protein
VDDEGSHGVPGWVPRLLPVLTQSVRAAVGAVRP